MENRLRPGRNGQVESRTGGLRSRGRGRAQNPSAGRHAGRKVRTGTLRQWHVARTAAVPRDSGRVRPELSQQVHVRSETPEQISPVRDPCRQQPVNTMRIIIIIIVETHTRMYNFPLRNIRISHRVRSHWSLWENRCVRTFHFGRLS